MFKKVLIANRGEIAVRIIQTCRDLEIGTIAVYTQADADSLHVRLADEAVLLSSSRHYEATEEILGVAQQMGADAIHPGYGFLAESAHFARACVSSGIAFIGPPDIVLERLQAKLKMLDDAEAAGFATPEHSRVIFFAGDEVALFDEAERLGFPLVIRAARGGRGRGTRIAFRASDLQTAVTQGRAETKRAYEDDSVYLERALWPAYNIDVQILADNEGNIIHLGERCSSLQQHNQKLITETPAPCLSPAMRTEIYRQALDLARMFGYRGAGTVEFIVDPNGDIYFSDFKSRIQVVHPVTEMVSGIDIVAEQIAIACGQPLRWRQDEVTLRGWALQVRVNAEDPWNHFLPSPGRLRRFRLPGGPHVRVDTYGYGGCTVPDRYDSLLAKVSVWGEDRARCIQRMRRALQDFAIIGVQTNLPMLQQIIDRPEFTEGSYDTDLIHHPHLLESTSGFDLRDIAIAAAIAFERRNHNIGSAQPARLTNGWHRSARRLPA